MNQLFPEAIIVGGAIEMLAGAILVAATYVGNNSIQNFVAKLPFMIVGTIIMIIGSKVMANGFEGYSLKQKYSSSRVNNNNPQR